MATEPTVTDAFSALTMSSREIADLTGKRHDHVIRDIKTMLVGVYGAEEVERRIPDHKRNRHSEFIRENADSILSAIQEGFGGSPNWGADQEHPFKWERNTRGMISIIHLDRSLTYTLVTGYDVEKRKKIIDRWLQLEAAASAPIASHDFYVPQTKAEALRLAADLTEQVEEQRQRLDVAEPKAEALDQMSALNAEPKGVRDVGRHLEIGQSKVADLVVQWGWACRESGKLKPTHYGREQGYTVLTSRVFTNKTTHEEHVVLDFKMTRKGINRMAVRLAQEARTKPRLEPGMVAKINNAP
ncbi:phage antirepressor KilAC domain-containing protein [Asaia sp. HumB]|uniref:phage antirepressor KilAC domain-containing protein n=1 Tax=Asaia sp. HumB TaxID=3035475 RepID=UPI0025542BC4|nr:phage antirepressor KilAC domain-containing protein [Asaia sp. HumB]MDL2172434.1 phage antirepressor KilAC domain-containing protein [Asaia sp. HumB]